jgi:hypothetical protein
MWSVGGFVITSLGLIGMIILYFKQKNDNRKTMEKQKIEYEGILEKQRKSYEKTLTKRLPEMIKEKAKEAAKEAIEEFWHIEHPKVPIPLWVQEKIDTLATGASQTIVTSLGQAGVILGGQLDGMIFPFKE